MLLNTLVEDTALRGSPLYFNPEPPRFTLEASICRHKSESRTLFCLPAPDFQSTSREFLMSRINSLTFSTSEREMLNKLVRERKVTSIKVVLNIFESIEKKSEKQKVTSEWFYAKAAIIRSPAGRLKAVQSSTSYQGTVLPPFKANVLLKKIFVRK